MADRKAESESGRNGEAEIRGNLKRRCGESGERGQRTGSLMSRKNGDIAVIGEEELKIGKNLQICYKD